jgi:hypothetical protein
MLSAELQSDCPLSGSDQNRNVLIFSANACLEYLAAPVIYVGVLQAALCQGLGASDTVANLPSTAYLASVVLTILVAWYWPYVRVLKAVVVSSYALASIIGLPVVVLLLAPVPNELKIAALVVHSGTLGAAAGVLNAFEMEMLGRAVSESRRGRALSLAYGVGPLLALASSFLSQLVLNGHFRPLFGFTEFPANFAVLYGATVPIMALAAMFSSRYVVSLPPREISRKPFVAGVFGGLREFLSSRLISLTIIGFLLVYASQLIMPNLTLFTSEAIDEPAEKYVGYQDGMRFAFKVVAGFFLGWLLTRTHPKAPLLLTTTLSLMGVVWALTVAGKWYLVSFGFLGAGELFYVYFSYYILFCSNKAHMRRNMAFLRMVSLPLALIPFVFGQIAESFGLRMSFMVAASLAAIALGVVLCLPARPDPNTTEHELSQTAAQPSEPAN